jgi:DNA-binding MarR family transcriptional regulator
VCFKLYVASRLVMRGYLEELAPLDLTYPKYVALLAVSEHDGATVGALAERLSLDFGTLSPLLKSLSERGYIERRRQKTDERSVANYISPAGRAVLQKAQAVAYELFCKTGISRAEAADLRTRLDDYIEQCARLERAQATKKQPGKRVGRP